MQVTRLSTSSIERMNGTDNSFGLLTNENLLMSHPDSRLPSVSIGNRVNVMNRTSANFAVSKEQSLRDSTLI